jgi:hypothetical protein
MEMSSCDKIKYWCESLADKIYKIFFSYKNAFIFANNKIYEDSAYIMNSKIHIFFEKMFNCTFGGKKRVFISYSGNKIFNVTIHASSNYEVKQKIKEIVKNYKNIHPKIKTNLPNFIENIYFIGHDNNIIADVKEKIDDSIICDNNDITFVDIALISGVNSNNVKSIQIIYVEDFEKKTKEFNFNEYCDKDISILNLIYESYY